MDPAYFYFKKFSVRHDRCTMKVGTDGVLLGAWTDVGDAKTILDIGTGTGVIALMLAQRTGEDTRIDAVELEAEDAQQAEQNVLHSPWPNQVKVICSAIQEFNPGKLYDLIVSNPPYFLRSYEPPDKKRQRSRHTTHLNYSDLLKAVTRLMHPKGRFHVVLPYTEGRLFTALAKTFALHCLREWTFQSRKHKPIERLLLEFSFDDRSCEKGEIVLYEQGEEWTAAYKDLTKDFYLRS